MDIKKIFESKTFQAVIWTLLVITLVVLVFAAGVAFGARKADFSYRWSENYHRNFAGPGAGFMDPMRGPNDNEFIKGHGIFGRIISINDSSLTIKDNDQVEKIIVIKEGASIKRNRDSFSLSDLKINDMVVVIGEPNEQGQIEAALIRVMPEAPVGFLPERLSGSNQVKPLN